MYMIFSKKYLDWVRSLYSDYKSKYQLNPERLNNLICYIYLERIANSDNLDFLEYFRVSEDRGLLLYSAFKFSQNRFEEKKDLCYVTPENLRPEIDDLDKFIIDYVLTYTADISTEQMTKNLTDKTSWGDKTKYPYPYSFVKEEDINNFVTSEEKMKQLYANPKSDANQSQPE